MKSNIAALSILLLACTVSAETITAYCACRKCCGQSAAGITARGKRPVEGRTVAASRSIPLGTRIYIEGLGWRTVEDRTAKRFDGRVDVYFRSHAEALKFGKQQRTIKINK